jgi:chemotaxis signal transduction protein
MAALSSLRSQRMSSQRAEIEAQYVAFRLRLGWFILPVSSIFRVMPIEKRVPTITLNGEKVPSIDLGRSLFGKNTTSSVPILSVAGSPVSNKPSLLVVRSQSQSQPDLVKSKDQSYVGLLSNSQPALLRIALRDIVPLPPTYAQQWKVDFITSMTLPIETRPSLFAIDPDRFVAAVLAKIN